MAARESQGLQITLIIFVMLTIILSVTTFIFYGNSKDYRKQADEAKKAGSESAEQMRQAQDERNALATTLGFPITEKKEEIEGKTKAALQKHAEFFANVPAPQQSYTKLIEEMAKTIDAKNQELAKAKQASDALSQKYQENADKWAKTLAAYEADKQKAVSSEKTNQTNYIGKADELSKQLTAAQAALSQKNKELQDERARHDNEMKKLADELKKSYETVKNKQDVIEGLTQAAPTVPDGRISWVNQRDDTVFINVGSDDSLQRRITFSVYDRNATDAANAVKKGSIEVLNIRGPHLAEARIMESTNSDPIVPGDIIYTPIWDPGQSQHFAIVGFIDFDNDGSSDRTKLRDLITHNGGVIDVEVDEKGNVSGQLSSRTNYLIKGAPPNEDDLPALITAFSTLDRQATANGVPAISVKAFLAQIGYSARSTGGAANTSGPRGIRAPTETPDGSKTSGQGFRERRPPQVNGNGNGAK
jgi:hypothetical protein